MSVGAGQTKSGSQGTQGVWGPQSSALQGLYAMAGNMAGSGDGTGFSADVLKNALPAFNDLLSPAGNPALTGAIDAAGSDITRQLTRNILPSLRDTAIGGGGLGGSRGAVAAGVAGGDAARAIGNVASTMRSDAYNGGQNRMLGAVQQAPGLSLSGIDAAWQPLLNFAKTIGAPAVLGSSSSSGKGKSGNFGVGA